MGAPRMTTYDRAIAAKEAAEERGHLVQRIVVRGHSFELVFLGESPEADPYDLVDVKR